MQMIIGHRMQSLFIDPAGILPMNHFSHEPEIFLHFLGKTAQTAHKIKIQYVCRIQTQSVDPEFRHPETNRIHQVIPHFRIAQVQFCQKIKTAPVIIGETVMVFIITPKIHIAVPVYISAVFPVCANILKRKKIAAGMIEHPIEHYPDAFFMTALHELLEIFIGSQTAVHLPIVRRVIAMRSGFKQRSDIDSAKSQLLDMPDPGKQFFKTVYRLFIAVLFRCPRQPQRINMVKCSFFIPCHFTTPLLIQTPDIPGYRRPLRQYAAVLPFPHRSVPGTGCTETVSVSHPLPG